MKLLGRKYPGAGYGDMFKRWLISDSEAPYDSFGNGSAMRVSAVVYAANSVEHVKELSHAATAVTHNHPRALKAAEATAVATYMARTGESMEAIRQHIEDNYYHINFDCYSLRMGYRFTEDSDRTVPPALQCFFESTDFENAICNAIFIGGDSDTIGAICGAVAGVYYGIPKDIAVTARTYMDAYQLELLRNFTNHFHI